MLRWFSKALGCVCALSLFWACGSDETEEIPPGTTGGTAGSAGGAGIAGSGGTAGAGNAGRGAANGGESGAETGASGGEAGSPEAGGAGGEAGTPGGTGGAGASGEAGMGGEGGSESAPAGVETCLACATGCDDEIERCEASPLCDAWLDCVKACDASACIASCDETYAQAPLLTAGVYECWCGSDCASECSLTGACDKSCEEGPSPPAASATAEGVLSATGLYTAGSGATGWQLAPYVQSYAPEYELWADGAAKQRYIYLPRCTPIDSTDMDHWRFPVGTRIWKQFTRDDVRVETRMLSRYGSGVSDWLMVSYQWALPSSENPELDPATAALAPNGGVVNANGTTHNIPGVIDCMNCHNKLSERVLSFSAIQLSYASSAGLSGVTFSDLADRGVLSDAPVRTGYDPPGNETERAALGYLHANCGNCHNETGASTPAPTLWLHLLVGQTSVTSTHAYLTAVNQLTGNPAFPGLDRIEPQNADQSSIILRMRRSPADNEEFAMPPVGRKLRDEAGIGTVSAWVNSLPQ